MKCLNVSGGSCLTGPTLPGLNRGFRRTESGLTQPGRHAFHISLRVETVEGHPEVTLPH